MIIAYNGKTPRIGRNVFIAPNATLIGDVIIEEGASIWFGVVLRADQNQIIIGAGANIQDNSVLHTNEEDGPTVVGPDVTVGHSVTMEGCRVGQGAVIGMNAVVLGGAEIGEKAMVAAGSVIGGNFKVPEGHLAAGIPAVVKKPLSGAALEAVHTSAGHYHHLRDEYLKMGIGRPE
ncbi:MAG: Carbonic anhydrase/acetyltransferase isoleucine patch superfamily [Chloroflexi bacterium]|nr:Carbonic anhydrase/acetyltransferase isoleucine patch superfamily [Chloroflexota bacterium]